MLNLSISDLQNVTCSVRREIQSSSSLITVCKQTSSHPLVNVCQQEINIILRLHLKKILRIVDTIN
jgi:nucleoside-triphosphatase THEP1